MPTSPELYAGAVDWLTRNIVPIAGAILILFAGLYLSRLAQRMINRLLPRATGIDRNFGPLLAQSARYAVAVFAVVTALGFLGVPSGSIFAVLGAAGLAIALALQSTLANIAAGIMLVWLRPIAIGEYVVGDGVAGVVIEIGLFGTRLRSTSGLYIFTPNQKLWNSAITNHSRERRRRIDVNFTVPDSINVARAREAVLKIARADPRVEQDLAPTLHVESFVGDKLVLQMRAWVQTPDYLPALRELTEQSKAAINRMLSGNAHAEVELAVDPHTPTPGEKTPDLT
ncbi:mechanosensitive ion channel family protein [Devosia sp.]|uniref:mechanosensitive ion channel family protein n=1 Tax=Devosia sp. TaxID=1871048 RepID=UPI003A957973